MDASDASSVPKRKTVALGAGIVVPYPYAANADATKVGKANRSSDTKAEVALRSTLHRHGLRFRKDQLIRCSNGVKVRPDVVFRRSLVAVFVDGCFWHCCPEHGRVPRRNVEYWVPKLQRNVERDAASDAALESDGWRVIRVWEHESPTEAQERVVEAVRHTDGRE